MKVTDKLQILGLESKRDLMYDFDNIYDYYKAITEDDYPEYVQDIQFVEEEEIVMIYILKPEIYETGGVTIS